MIIKNFEYLGLFFFFFAFYQPLICLEFRGRLVVWEHFWRIIFGLLGTPTNQGSWVSVLYCILALWLLFPRGYVSLKKVITLRVGGLVYEESWMIYELLPSTFDYSLNNDCNYTYNYILYNYFRKEYSGSSFKAHISPLHCRLNVMWFWVTPKN